MKAVNDDEIKLFKRTFSYLKPYKAHFVYLYAATIAVTVLELIPLYYMGVIIDSIVKKNYFEVLHTIVILAGIFCLDLVLSFIETYLNNWLKLKISYHIKNDLFAQVVKISTESFDQIRVGELISRIEEDTSTISKFLIEDVLNTIIALCTMIVTGFFILKLSITLSVIAMVTFPFSYLVYYLFGKKIKKDSREGRIIRDNYFSFLQESLLSIREIKCLTIESKILNRFITYSHQFFKNNMKISIASSFSGLTNMIVTTISDWIIITIGAWLIISDKLSIGSYVAFNGYLAKFLNSIQKVLSINLTVQVATVSMERIYYLLDLETENEQFIESDINHGRITINNLGFSYNNSSYETIKNVSMEFQPQTASAIVGLNGCGKSTLFNLLVRLYKHTSGEILIDGIPIETLSLTELRKNIAYIHQEPFLFNDTIRNNLLIVKPDATEKEIQEACKQAYIEDYINALPDKYDTIIGNGGIQLSGGQKQRISIAMAILKRSKIFLLDEITSDLDGESEHRIMKSIHGLAKNHTVLIIAHRLSSIIDCSLIYVLDQGIIIDWGNHNELLRRCSIYSSMFASQAIG